MSNNGKEKNQEDLRDFDHSLPMSLLRAREAVMRGFIPALRDNELTPEQWRVIRALELEDGLELAELSTRCFLLAPSLSRIAKNMVERNLLERRNVAGDQRRAKMFLTEEGKKLFAKVAPESLQQYAKLTEAFGAEKLEHLYDLLDELVTSLNKDQK